VARRFASTQIPASPVLRPLPKSPLLKERTCHRSLINPFTAIQLSCPCCPLSVFLRQALAQTLLDFPFFAHLISLQKQMATMHPSEGRSVVPGAARGGWPGLVALEQASVELPRRRKSTLLELYDLLLLLVVLAFVVAVVVCAMR